MNFEIDEQEKFTVIRAKVSKLDSHVAPELKSHLVVLNGKGVKSIIIDLSDSKYCDSSGLSAVLVANRLCRNNAGTFVLTGLQDAVRKLITISQLDTVLTITPTYQEAVDYIFMEEVEKNVGGAE